MFRECPAFSSWDISRGRRGFDLSPSAMGRKADHGIPNAGTGAAALAGRVGICRRADRYSPSGRRMPRQRSRAVAPFADRLGPLIPPSLEPVPDSAARIEARASTVTTGAIPNSASLSACAGLSADRLIVNPALMAVSDQAPVLDSDRVVAKDGLVREGDGTFLPVLATTSSRRSVPSICGPYPGRSPACA